MSLINTKRLVLRPLSIDDLDELYSLQSDPDVMKFIGQGIRTFEEVKANLDLCLVHQKQFGFGLHAVLDKTNRSFLGRAGIIHLGLNPKSSEVELAFAFKSVYWNQGYGYETANHLLDNWFENSNHHKVVAVTRIENKSCIKLLKKLGMEFSHFGTYQTIANVGYFSLSRMQHLKLKDELNDD